MSDTLLPNFSRTNSHAEAALSGRKRRNPTTLLAVIVLYRISPHECKTLASLIASLSRVPAQDLRMKVIVYDNTPGGHDPGVLPENAKYLVAPGNYGLASAYNIALDMAGAEGYDWLLTLDQDTDIPDSFLGRVAAIAEELSLDMDVAAIVPQVSDHGVVISPHVVLRGYSKELPNNFAGIAKFEIEAINSATAWRVSALQEFGGFNLLFWLDYLDYWLCHMVHRSGKHIYVAADIKVNHELSILDVDNKMSAERFENFLQAESAFCDMYKGRLDGLALTVRLIARICKQSLRGVDITFRRLTWECFKRRVTQTTHTRLESWQRRMSVHIPT